MVQQIGKSLVTDFWQQRTRAAPGYPTTAPVTSHQSYRAF